MNIYDINLSLMEASGTKITLNDLPQHLFGNEVLEQINDIKVEFNTHRGLEIEVSQILVNSKTFLIYFKVDGMDRSSFLLDSLKLLNIKYEDFTHESGLSTLGHLSSKGYYYDKDGEKTKKRTGDWRPNIKYIFKPLKSLKGVNYHEEMTAALLVNGKEVKSHLTLNEAKELSNNLKISGKKVSGIDQTQLEKFDDSYEDLIKAVSASNYILSLGTPKNVFMAGKKWPSHLSHLNDFTQREYNSSDILIETTDELILGVSLKKKIPNSGDPYLVNTTMDKFFDGILSPSDKAKIRKKKIEFFTNLVNSELGTKFKKSETQWKETKKKLGSEVSRDTINKALKSKNNIFFKNIAWTLQHNKEEFIDKFLKYVFRTDLKSLEKYNFDFHVVTGIGEMNSKGLVASPAKATDLNTAVEKVDEILGNPDTLKINPTKGKQQAYEGEDGQGSATLYFSIYSNRRPILDIEIRYRGVFSGSPTFMAVISPRFKEIFR
jgi:hypothetical protein